MIDGPRAAESPAPNPQAKVDQLLAEVNAKNPEEVSPLTKAQLAVELTKQAVDLGTLSPQAAIEFANSLTQYSMIPVTIGVPDRKIFPIANIIEARKAIIDNNRKGYAAVGADIDQVGAEYEAKAQKIADVLEMGSEQIYRSYAPFNLAPAEASAEFMNTIKTNAAAQDLLNGGVVGQEQQEAAVAFMELNFANFISGQELAGYVKKNYQISP